jgi:chaperonin cofactor prefoldin
MVAADILARLEEQKSSVAAAIETVTWQITSLERFYSKQQVRCWKRWRRNLNVRLKKLKSEINAINRTTKKNIPRGAR